MPPAPTVTRFAPSPTGYLHLGHAHAALQARAAAGGGGGRPPSFESRAFTAREAGRFLLRIENIDQGRCRPEFEAAIYEDLAWLGLTWETPVRRQSEHFDDYRGALDSLQNLDLLYPCFCTRADITAATSAPHLHAMGPDGPIYPGTCRHLPPSEQRHRMDAGAPYAMRLRMHDARARVSTFSWHDATRGEIVATPEIFGDVVLARKDTPASYHLACTVDDALQGVTLVTRGEDLFAATHIHRLLQALLKLPTPAYAHHGLITGVDGKKFSKRDQAPTLRALRESGRTAEEVRAMSGYAN